jgi:hypothetical protein
VIVLCEAAARFFLPGRVSAHEVDDLLHQIETHRFDADVVVVGDSVARQLFFSYRDDPRIAMLAANQAIEAVGYDYVLERYLRANSQPRAIVVMESLFLHRNLEQRYTENYVQRCFTHWNEIAELAWSRRSPTFGLKMAVYSLSTIAAFRLPLQKRLVGFANLDPYSGQPRAAKEQTPGTDYGLFRRLHEYILSKRKRSISDEYFERLLREAQARGIRVILLPRPLSESAHARIDRDLQGQDSRLRDLQLQYSRFQYRQEALRLYPDSWFRDGIHFKAEHIAQVRQDLAPFLGELQ